MENALAHLNARLRPHAPAAFFGLAIVALMLIWAVHNGGYDSETWYWGALATLALLAAAMVALAGRGLRLSRLGLAALVLFALYVAWSYLSITWAQSPGDALQGSNRALLYLMVFALLMTLPWTVQGAMVALATWSIGIGVIGVVLLTRLASDDRVSSLFVDTRLAAPTGYINSAAALFTIGALLSIGLSSRRQLPGLARGLLTAFACADLQLALIVESRGWLFTLPVVALLAILVSTDRLRVAAMAVIPVVGSLLPLHRLIAVYEGSNDAALGSAAARAGQAALLICGVAFVLGTLLAWADQVMRRRPLTLRSRRAIGTALSVLVVLGAVAGGTIATKGHPFPFISREWMGLSRPQRVNSSSSHFADVGSDRYDFWRVAVRGFLGHPIGGLGQDNFADYYVVRRHSGEEPQWTHSIELRLLTHTGAVGFLLFAAFLVSALALAWRARRRADAVTRGVVGICLLPLIVWLVHGSVDWFWEVPALSGPALGFLGVACSLGAAAEVPAPAASRRASGKPLAVFAGVAALVAGAVVLGFSYLSVLKVSLASDVRLTNPAAALVDLEQAATLNPLSSEPTRLAGTIALQGGQYSVAQTRFRQSVEREPGGWYSWLGAGLAASSLGQAQRAHKDFEVAYSINSQQPAVKQALARVSSARPLTPPEAFKLLVLAQ